MGGAATGSRLEFRRRLAAPRERVFRAWTEAAGLSRWLAPGEARVVAAEADAKPGGRWSVTMRGPAGEAWVVGGVYEEVTAPSRVALTWRWSHEPEDARSRVVVELEDTDGGTLLHVVHEGLVGPSRDGHAEGWESCLARLESALTS